MKKYIIAAIVLFGVGIAFTAEANPITFPVAQSSASATSSVVYMTPGLATTTLTFDSYASSINYGQNDVTLLVQETASSTSSVLNVAIEYSQDGIDWYGDAVNRYSTTTPAYSLNTVNSFTWTAAGTTRTGRAIRLESPVRYIRATFSNTGAGLGLWASFQPRRDSN